MIKRFINKRNLVYAIIFLITSIYLVFKEGWGSYFNFASILFALFIPIFVFIRSYKIVMKIILNEIVSKYDVYLLVILISSAFIVYLIGLEKAQRIVLIVIDSILCFFILLIMLHISFKREKE